MQNDSAGNGAVRRDATVQQNPHPHGERVALLVHSIIGADREAWHTIEARRRIESEWIESASGTRAAVDTMTMPKTGVGTQGRQTHEPSAPKFVEWCSHNAIVLRQR